MQTNRSISNTIKIKKLSSLPAPPLQKIINIKKNLPRKFNEKFEFGPLTTAKRLKKKKTLVSIIRSDEISVF